ncbi:MAG: nucleotide exchange factor GrpE [Dehalococcoidia bacterium]|nr:nucleotide exchange factor GrpE [Dehalococcoidia bacterium]
MQNGEQRNESAEDSTEEASNAESDIERQLREAQEQARTYLTNWQRTQADFENYKKRAQLERREAMDIANSSLLTRLLSALDDMERTFSRPTSEMRKVAWVEGARLSFQKFKTALATEGVEQIDATGKPFDPHFHQAVMRRPGEEGMVLEEVQKGYVMNGRVLRPSMVVVGQEEVASEINDGSVQ